MQEGPLNPCEISEKAPLGRSPSIQQRNPAGRQIVIQVERILQCPLPHLLVGHDRSRVLEEIADVAVLVVGGDVVVVRVRQIGVELGAK